MLLVYLMWAVQIGMIVHVMKTGRPFYWAWILILAPGIGAIAYLIAEILPEMQNSHKSRRALRGIKKTLDPGAELRRRQFENRLSGSVDSARYLAEELIEKGRYGEAIAQYQTALTGIYETDPDLLLGLATAQYGDGSPSDAKSTLDKLKEHNPEYRSPEGHLLYAKALEDTDELDQAEEEYAALAGYYPGVEARVRYAQLLERLGKSEQARQEYASILASAELAPRHFRKAQKKWLAEAKSGASRVG